MRKKLLKGRSEDAGLFTRQRQHPHPALSRRHPHLASPAKERARDRQAGEGQKQTRENDGNIAAPPVLSPSRVWREGSRFLALLLALVLVCAGPTSAVCTQSGNVTSSSTAIVGANDISGLTGRHYMLVQNTGVTNPMNVAIGSSNTATSKDLYLAPGASWVLTAAGPKMVPGGDVAAISASGTTYSFCDW